MEIQEGRTKGATLSNGFSFTILGDGCGELLVFERTVTSGVDAMVLVFQKHSKLVS